MLVSAFPPSTTWNPTCNIEFPIHHNSRYLVTSPTSFHLCCLGLGSVTVVLQSTLNILPLHNYLILLLACALCRRRKRNPFQRQLRQRQCKLEVCFALERDLVRCSNCQSCGFFMQTAAFPTWLIPSARPTSFPVIPPRLLYSTSLSVVSISSSTGFPGFPCRSYRSFCQTFCSPTLENSSLDDSLWHFDPFWEKLTSSSSWTKASRKPQ